MLVLAPTLPRARLAALVGRRGAANSPLLHTGGFLGRPTAGDVIIEGRACSRLPDRERTRLRCRHIGFVYQFHHLLPDFSAVENVMMPQLVAGTARREARVRAGELLARLGLRERPSHPPRRPSGGEHPPPPPPPSPPPPPPPS